MKSHVLTIGKAIGFFAMWLATTAVFTIPAIDEPAFLSGNPALLRLWWELIPLLGVLLCTGMFIYIIEKRKITVSLFRNCGKSLVLGIILGILWLGSSVLVLYIIGVFNFGSRNETSYMPIWFLAVLLNVIMQNYLVRGYLFSLFSSKYNTAVATAITTILFTAMHGGAFEAGIIAVLNVITMSVFVSLLLIYTESLLAPIIVHFIWNAAGCFVFDGVSLAGDYPSIWSSVLSGSDLLTGGFAKIEGSIVVLFINAVLIAFTAFFIKRRHNTMKA